MSQSPQSLAGLSLTEKRMLLAELLRDKANQGTIFPLSHGQRGLWFLSQLDHASAAYNIFFPARIRARLDVPAFQRALQTLIERHPSLRTTFEQHNGEPLQRVHPSVDCTSTWWEVRDASSWSEEELLTRVEEEAYRPFDLERGPLVRMHLFSRSPDEHVFLLTAHHIIGDFWSLVLLMEEMQQLYPGGCSPPSVLHHPLSAQVDSGQRTADSGQRTHYRDFVRWQAEMLASHEGERLGSYWEKQLAGVSPVLELPLDRPRPSRFTSRGAAVACRIDPDLTRRVKALAATEGVTPYTILLAGFQVLLGRHSGQDDFVIGSPFAGRSRSEFEHVVGYFINMLPLRAKLSADPTFRELLRQTSATVLEALQHQDYPFPLLVERLNLPRDPSRPPLVQASFTLEKAHRPVGLGCWSFFLPQTEVRLNVGGLPAEPYRLEHRTCQMDLEMILEESDGTLYGILRYNADLFDEETMVRLVEHYRVLLEESLNDPERRISQLPLLTPAEENRLLHEWNDTRTDYPRDLRLHQLFEQQAARTPEAIALRFGEQTIRYGELEAWANRLAERLRLQGVAPETLVALCLERSPEMIAAILGVLKAGGAYVPLDPASPGERLRSILVDTHAPILLTQRRLANRLPSLETQVIYVDDDSDLASPQHSGERGCVSAPSASLKALPNRTLGALTQPRSSRPSDLAYVLFTSGSTGRPKGVMIEHRAICNTICWHMDALHVRPDDRLLLLVPYVFDASLSIIFAAFAAGAELVLAAPGEERDPARILERIRRDQVTVLPIPPRQLRLMLDERLREAGRTLRWVFCGGEAMPPDLPARLFELVDVPLYNLYGPTETAIDATWWTCRRGDDRSSIPIGRPIANVQVYVLDQQRRPVPIGVPGELYIGGAGLARGYLNDPQLTAERFVPDPFRPGPGARLYRTGDRCRWLADGTLEFLGRLDQQLKLNGRRIEIGEIEALLAMHPAVQESAVIVYGEESESQRLVAYVSARAGAGLPTAPVLRRYLQERLPEYMVPSSFVLVPSMPHLPSGKVNRKALPAPLTERPASHPFLAPRTPLEEYLAGLWRDLLGVQQIGVLDNFFELGGNSIQAAVLINRIQEKLNHQVYTVALFDSPTIAGLAHYLMELCPDTIRARFGAESLPAEDDKVTRWQGDKLTNILIDSPSPCHPVTLSPCHLLLVSLQPNGARTPCFMVHPPGGIVVCYQPLAHRLGDDRPVYGLRSRGLHGETELPASLEEMAAEYVAAIRAVQPHGPYHLGGWSMGGVVAYEMAQQLRKQGEPIGLLALLDTTIPWNAANASFAEDAYQSAREYGLDITLEELDRLGPEEQLPYLWDHVRKLGLVDADTPLQLVQQILDDLKRLFHAHIKLGSEYALRPYPGRLTLFRPAESPVPVPVAPDRNWGKLAAGVDVHFVPGQHHTMVKEPHVQVLAQQLRECLRQAERGGW
ncbi:MAG TPA: amino acid adenylation domain-containing protein [Gemmataceae bacterium]|nr:amino acid adenylation domain-containing protein [Gemmataceae bacterium]